MSIAFDRESRLLWVDGRHVRLQDQPARALAYLIDHHDRIVTREELITHLWSDGRHVQFDQSLNYCIRRVRSAFGDRADAPRYIASIGRQGYRWIGPPTAHGPVGAARRRLWQRPVPAWIAAATSGVSVVVTVWLAPPFSMPPQMEGADLRSAIRSIHVLSHRWLDPVASHLLDHVRVRDQLRFTGER